MPASEKNSDQKTGRGKRAATAKQQCVCQKSSKTKSLNMRWKMHGYLLDFNNDILKDTQMPVLMMFKLEKVQ